MSKDRSTNPRFRHTLKPFPASISSLNTAMPTLQDLLACYPVLESLVGELTKWELDGLVFSCKKVRHIIAGSDALFKTLKSRVLCDGKGVDERKERDTSIFDKRCCNANALISPENLHCLQGTRRPCSRCGFAVCEVNAAKVPGFESL